MQKVQFGATTLVLLLIVAAVSARVIMSGRPKRVSDQRIAELETLLALARLRGRLLTVPIGYGLIDPVKLGRKKRHLPVKDTDGSAYINSALLEPALRYKDGKQMWPLLFLLPVQEGNFIETQPAQAT